MRVIEPYQLNRSRSNKYRRRSFSKGWLIAGVTLLIVPMLLEILCYTMPLPKISAKTVNFYDKNSTVNLPWPNFGQSAIGANGYGLLASSKVQTPMPMASIAKVVTAMAVLKAKPINGDEQGPTLTLTSADVDIYNNYLAKNGSRVLVANGEQISEHQALEAMLLPSANNMADSLANWAFGSIDLYSVYANQLVKQMGLKNTTITSASGFPPQTVSTADDLVKLGIKAMNNQVLSKIVGQKTAVVPLAGEIKNVNFLLGQEGIIGIKTGNTDQAGGCYLFAANHTFSSDHNVTLVGATMGAQTLAQAEQASLLLLRASIQNFSQRKLITKGDTVGFYKLPWGGQVKAVASQTITVWTWNGRQSNIEIKLSEVPPGTKVGNIVGKIQIGDQSSAAILQESLNPPSWRWRLLRWLS